MKKLLFALTAGAALMAAGQALADEPGNTFVFGGVDGQSEGLYGYAGGGVRVGGGDIDSDGFVLRVAGGYGAFKYDRGVLPKGEDRTTQVDLMVGYQNVGETTRTTIYVGANYQNHQISNDPGNPTAGSDWGFKAQGELYSNPTPNSMLLLIGSYASPNQTYFVLGKVGWRLRDNIFFGPEASANGNTRYDQWRVGLHVTGFQVGPVGLGVSVGYADSEPGFNGIYGSVGATLRY